MLSISATIQTKRSNVFKKDSPGTSRFGVPSSDSDSDYDKRSDRGRYISFADSVNTHEDYEGHNQELPWKPSPNLNTDETNIDTVNETRVEREALRNNPARPTTFEENNEGDSDGNEDYQATEGGEDARATDADSGRPYARGPTSGYNLRP